MSHIDTIVSCLSRIIVLKDHSAAIGTKEKDEKLVSIMLNWFDFSLKFFSKLFVIMRIYLLKSFGVS